MGLDVAGGCRRVRWMGGGPMLDGAKGSRRPYGVEADRTRVTAVGASCTVNRGSGRDEQGLGREGVVELADSTLPRRQPVRLAANMLATAAPTRKSEVQ